MATRAAARALLSKYIFEHHPNFDVCQYMVDFMAGREYDRAPRKGSPTSRAAMSSLHAAI
jgi:hypothetical protein